MNVPLRLQGRVNIEDVDFMGLSGNSIGGQINSRKRVSIRDAIDPVQAESVLHHIPKEISSLLKSNNLKKKKFLRKLDPTKVRSCNQMKSSAEHLERLSIFVSSNSVV